MKWGMTMWERAELKNQAKSFLKGSYVKAIVASLAIAVATSAAGNSGNNNSSGTQMNYRMNQFDNMSFEQVMNNTWVPWIIGLGALVGISAFLLFVGFKLLIANPLNVGARKFFILGSQDEDEAHLGHLGAAFRKEHYGAVVWAMFYRGVMNFLFFLLLIIPGIIKLYAYRFVPYILAENPQIGAQRALQMSEEMTQGHKFDIFVLDLSFLGWHILARLALGLGWIFLNPYIDATDARLYLHLKQEALSKNLVSQQELSALDF
jgi:hypothetical protein